MTDIFLNVHRVARIALRRKDWGSYESVELTFLDRNGNGVFEITAFSHSGKIDRIEDNAEPKVIEMEVAR